MTNSIPVACAVIYRSDLGELEILAAQRATGEKFEEQWEFPGGKVEPGESFEEAVRRELREELGVDLVLGEQLIGELAGGGWDMGNGYILYPFFAELEPTAEIELGPQHSELRWLAEDELDSVEWVSADLPVLRVAWSVLTARLA